MYAVMFGILIGLFFALQQFFSSKGLKLVDKYFFMLLQSVLVVFVLFVIALSSDFIMPSVYIIGLIVLIGIIGFVALLFFYKGLEVGKLALISSIFNSYPLVTVLLSVYFYKETLSFWQILGIISIFIGIFLISFDYKELKKLNFKILDKSLIFAFVTLIGWGLYLFLQKPVVDQVGSKWAIFYIELAVGIFTMLYFYNKLLHLKEKKVDKSAIKYILLSATFIILSGLTFTYAIMDNGVAIVSSLAGFLTPLFALIFAFIFLKEKIEPIQLVGICLSAVGVLLISL